ncbi:MAG: DNA repair protein RecN [Pseudomonadota bacterium]|nr:DNA repair protein RecN [Pseudomonadota bacterium]
MLERLHIKDFVIIDRAQIELHGALNTITGETGAGKSIMLDALLLCLGAKAEAGQIRAGQKEAVITAEFSLGDNNSAQAWLSEASLDDPDDPEHCIIRRVLRESGSKAYINGQAVTLQQLKALSEQLMYIHSQHEHQRLTKSAYQRELLDAYTDHKPLLEACQSHYQQWQEANDKFIALRDQQSELAQQKNFIEFQLQELEQLNPEADEFETLEEQFKQLSHSEEILANCQQASQWLTGDDGSSGNQNAEQILNQAQRAIESIIKFAPRLKESADVLDSALINLQEASQQIEEYASSLELDPAELEAAESRLNSYNRLARKHGIQAEELSALFERLKTEYSAFDSPENDLASLEKSAKKSKSAYLSSAKQLSQSRQKAATQLATQVEAQVRQLGMVNGQFQIQISEATLPSAFGIDNIEFQVSLNPGQPLRPLGKTASGGELSRISLAIQVVAAEKTHMPSVCFDEVDVGIGGGVAEVVGELLQNLSRHTQILCITHLPQVAAHGHIHWLVRKSQTQEATQTQVQALSRQQRIEELARMMGGLTLTEQTLAHAQEMLDQFQQKTHG